MCCGCSATLAFSSRTCSTPARPRVLRLPSFGLAHLLDRFCDVKARLRA